MVWGGSKVQGSEVQRSEVQGSLCRPGERNDEYEIPQYPEAAIFLMDLHLDNDLIVFLLKQLIDCI